MPPRQRPTKTKGNPKGGTQENAESAERVGEPRRGKQEEHQRAERKKKGVSWTPVFKRIGVFFLIILIPTLLNYAALNQEARMLVPAGATLYDIGWNQKLLLRCNGTGLPTVLLEAPIGQSSDIWALVEPLVAKRTKVCVYDRAGLGFSDRAYQNTSLYSDDFSEAALDRDRTTPSTVERMVDDLHRLITYSSNQPKPLLMVSLDFSTFISRFYTQLYEHEVAGLLLIDPAFEMLFDTKNGKPENGNGNSGSGPEGLTWHEYWYKRITPHAQSMWLSSIIGFNRLSLMLGLTSPFEDPRLVSVLPEDVVLRKKYLKCQPKHLSSVLNEFFYMNESMDQMKTVFKVKPFPHHLPIVIATYEKVEQSDSDSRELSKVWMDGQKQLLENIHPNSKRVALPGSDYMTLYTHPKTVANLILTMVEQWRKESKLSA